MTRSTPDMPILGDCVSNWSAAISPTGEALLGQFAALVPLDAEAHAALLYQFYEGHDQVWDYLPYGPFSSSAQYYRWVQDTIDDKQHLFYAIRNLESGQWQGVASYLRINSTGGSIEIGNINYAPVLQQTRASTEAMYLMMRWAFENGYRRYEWKCNALNLPSRRAAQRLGFSFEGVFRQAVVVKGRNRDTAWFAIVDREWPALKEAFEAWLAPSNFTADGHQIEALGDLTRLVRVASDPAL